MNFKTALWAVLLSLSFGLISDAKSIDGLQPEFTNLPHAAKKEANRGLDQFKRLKFEESIVSFTKALEICCKEEIGWKSTAVSGRKWRKENDEVRTREKENKLSQHMAKRQVMCLYIARAHANVEMERYKQAISDYTKALEYKIEPETSLIGRATAWMTLDNYEQAISDYGKAIKQSPDDSDLFFFRAICWLKLSDVINALSDVENAIRIDPNNKEFLQLRATCHEMNRDFVSALRDYEQALEIEPTSIQGMCDLAELLSCCPDSQLVSLNRANRLAISACTLSQWKQWEPIFLLAQIQLKQGNIAKAIDSKTKALAIAPIEFKDQIEQSVHFGQQKTADIRFQPVR